MNLTTIEITEEEAKEKLAEYEAALRVERNVEDQAIAMGYRAAARGLPIIRMTQAVANGGYFDNGLPRIAICPAEAAECWVRWSSDDLVFGDEENAAWRNRGALVGRHTVRVPMKDSLPTVNRWHRAHTIVPLIPPRHRPKPRRLRHCHILWEVEAWAPVPAKDPALLRHIRGDLWAVLAVWDLTELERYVLSQR